jgi:hypothetical protein
VFSLIAVGGSTTECSLVSDGKTWTDVLAGRLNERFDNIWVNNAGLDGHSTFGHTILLNDIILSIHPNLLLLLVGANDVGLEKPNAHTASHIEGPVRFEGIEGLVKSLAYRSEIMNLVLNGYRAWRANYRGLFHTNVDLRSLGHVQEYEEDVAQLLARHQSHFIPFYRERLENLVETCTQNQIDVVLITQPALYGYGIDGQTGVDLASVAVQKGMSGATKWKVLELYNDCTRTVAAQRGVELIDLATELPKNSALFYDFLHYTNEGSVQVGTIVAKHVEEYLSERRTALETD